MLYMLLIYSDEKKIGAMPEAELGRMMGEYSAFTKQITDSGQYKEGARLKPTPSATSVRVREGKTLTTHGPFAETHEQLGGYYIVEARDIDEAVTLAARIPGARLGSIEVRPVWTTATS
jgi:hypothetical protein